MRVAPFFFGIFVQDKSDSWLSRFSLGQRHPILGLVAATAITVLAFIIRSSLNSVLPPGLPYVTFFPAVVLSAFLFGVWPGVLSAMVGLLFSWYFFIPPIGWTLDFGGILALVLYTFVVTVDIALIYWMQQARAKAIAEQLIIRNLAETRAMLFQELQHRVGNNLQMVGSILALQRRGLSGDAAKAIGEAAQRVALIGAMQRDLYKADGAQMSLRDLVEQVCDQTLRANGRDDVSVTVNGGTADVLSPSRAIPASVVVAETVANALEHGFAGRSGQIAVDIARNGPALLISVSDDGAGLPDHFALENSSSLGLRLATALARQLSGDYTLRRDGDRTVACLTIGPDPTLMA